MASPRFLLQSAEIHSCHLVTRHTTESRVLTTEKLAFTVPEIVVGLG